MTGPVPQNLRKAKKSPVPQGNRARQDGRVVQARGCLPTGCPSEQRGIASLLLQKLVLHLRFCCKPLLLLLHTDTTVMRRLSTATTTTGTAATSRRCCWCWLLRSLLFNCHCGNCHCENCHCWYGSNTTRGEDRVWVRCIVAPMETSVKTKPESRSGETRGIGSAVRRIARALVL